MTKKETSLTHLLSLLRKSFNSKKFQGMQARSRGRPFTYSPHAMVATLLIMTLRGIKSFKRMHKFLKEHPAIRKYCGFKRLPHRSTLSRRLRAFFCDMLRGRSYIWEPNLAARPRHSPLA
jgi:hypothetical protein